MTNTSEHNRMEWHATNPGFFAYSPGRGRGSMTNPARSQQLSMSQILSSCRPVASGVVVPTSPASGFSQSSRMELLWRLSFAVSSSPRSSAWTFQAVSSPVGHTMAFWRRPTIILSAAFAQSVRGYGGRTRRMQCGICGNSTLG